MSYLSGSPLQSTQPLTTPNTRGHLDHLMRPSLRETPLHTSPYYCIGELSPTGEPWLHSYSVSPSYSSSQRAGEHRCRRHKMLQETGSHSERTCCPTHLSACSLAQRAI